MMTPYGIYLGSKSASIAKIDADQPVMIHSDALKEKLPLAILITRKGSIKVGDAAVNYDKVNGLYNLKPEYSRVSGSNSTYCTANTTEIFSSEVLLEEVFKKLISLERESVVKKAVIALSLAYGSSQLETVRKASQLAGLKYVDIIYEPIASAYAYGLNLYKSNGIFLDFQFTSKCFYTSLLSIENGKISIIDSDGDSLLGGNNLDIAIVDGVIIPYLEKAYVIRDLLRDDIKNNILRTTLKFYAEEIKKQLSFNDEASILTNLGDILGEDDEGNELELDISLTASELESVIAPVFQEAIDISQQLLKRNNIDGSKLTTLLLAGGPTLSPILRRMLSEQICKPDTSVDPVTVVAKGAAIYASDIMREEETFELSPIKIQLEINFEQTSVFDEEDGVIKILMDKTAGKIPEKVFANVIRQDGGWSSGNIEINSLGEIITVQLEKAKSNAFIVVLYDNKGNRLECEPSTFNILQGAKGRGAVLPYNIGIEVYNIQAGMRVFKTINGLSKSIELPAIGILNNIETLSEIKPGVALDIFELKLFQGEYGADGTRSIYNHHIGTIFFTGDDLPCLLPANNNFNLIISIDINQSITAQAYFPIIDFTCNVHFKPNCEIIDEERVCLIDFEIENGLNSIEQLILKGFGGSDVEKAKKELEEIKSNFENDKFSTYNILSIIEELRKVLKLVDRIVTDYRNTHNTQNFVTREDLEDLLFKLTEDGLISSVAFQDFYERIASLNYPDNRADQLFNDLKAYESK